MVKYERRVYLVYAIAVLTLFGVSFLSLVWNYWSVVVSYASGMVFGFINLILLMKQSKNSSLNLTRGFVGARQLILLLGVVIPALIIYFIYPKDGNKLFFLGLLATGVPYLLVSAVIAIVIPREKELVSEENIKPAVKKENTETRNEEKKETEVKNLDYFPKLADYGFSKVSWNVLTSEQKQNVLVQIAEGKIKILTENKGGKDE